MEEPWKRERERRTRINRKSYRSTLARHKITNLVMAMVILLRIIVAVRRGANEKSLMDSVGIDTID